MNNGILKQNLYTKDIRIDKRKLRNKFKNIRTQMQQKNEYDNKVYTRLINTWAFREADLVLTYVSTEIEVDTIEIINHCIKNNKKVAVPYCCEQNCSMRFFLIDSLDQLKKRTFGVLEPIAEQCEQVIDFSNSICIVPALSFDKFGYRLGYGKGYYDRFLSTYTGKTIGICYEQCMSEQLPKGKYDKKVDSLITNKKIYNFN